MCEEHNYAFFLSLVNNPMLCVNLVEMKFELVLVDRGCDMSGLDQAKVAPSR